MHIHFGTLTWQRILIQGGLLWHRAFQLLTLSITFVLAFCGYVHYAQLARMGPLPPPPPAYNAAMSSSGVYTGK